MSILNQKEIDEWKSLIDQKNPPPKPILSERPGLTYKLEGFTFFKPRTIHTKQVFENGKWVEYDKKTGKKTGRI